MNEQIVDFINKHHVLTLATKDENGIYCSNMFYAFDKEKNMFIFTSDDDTKHAKDMIANKNVAVSIVLETKIVGKIQGVQINGTAHKPDRAENTRCKTIYLKRFPYAILSKTNFWTVKINFAKFTNNKLGFGKKIIWKNNQQ